MDLLQTSSHIGWTCYKQAAILDDPVTNKQPYWMTCYKQAAILYDLLQTGAILDGPVTNKQPYWMDLLQTSSHIG